MLWNPLQPRGIQRNPQSEVYAPDAWTDGDLRFRWSPEAGGVLEVAGIPGRPLPYQMSCPSPSEGRRWTLTLAGMLRQGRLPPEGVFRASGPLPPPGSTDGRGGIVVGMYKGEGKGPDGQTGGKWVTMHGRHVYIDKNGQMVNPPKGMAGKTHSPKQGDRFDLPAQGQRSRFQVEVTHVDGDTAHVSYRSHPGDAAADSPFSESDKNRHVKMPAASVKHFVNDLSGRVDGTPDSRHQAVNAVLRGEGQFLGKGDDGVVFRVGDQVVKVSTTVPYQPTNAGHLTPEAAADRLMKQADVMGKMRAEGIPGIPEVEALRHGDKAFMVMPFLDIPENNKLTEDQFEQLTDSVKALHRQGWRIRDTIQAGIGKDGKVYQFDLGKAAKYESGTQAAKQYAEDDLDHLRSVQIDSGIPDKHSPTLEADWEEARDPMWMEIAHERGDDHRARISELFKQMVRKDADDRRRDPEAHKASGRSIIKELGEASKAWKTLVDKMGPPMKKGRSTITILFKGKRITGPVAFLTNKEDGHVFPVSASDPKAVAAMNTPRHREIVEKIHAETTDPKKKAVHAEHLATLGRLAGASEHPADKRFGELLAEGKVADEDREHFRKFYDKFDNQKNIPAGTRANMTAMYYETQAHRRERDERTRKEQAKLERMAAEREQRIRERQEEIARIQADASAAIKKITGDRDVAQLDESEIQRAMKIAKDANLTQQEGSFRGEIVRRDKEEKAKTEALGQEARALALRADIANAKEVGHRVQEKNGNLFVEDRPGAFSQGAIVSVNGKAHRVDGAGQAYSRIEGPRSHEPGEMAFRRGEEGSRRSGREADGYTVGQMIRDRKSGKWFRVTSTHSEYIPSDGMSFGYGFDRGWAHNAIARPATEEESAPHEQRHQAQQDKKTALSDLKALHASLKGETEGETNKIVADTQQHERIKIPTERALGGPLTEGEFRIGPDTITAYHPGYYDDYTETARQVKRTPELEDKIRQLHAKATQEIPTGRIDLPDMKGKPYHAEGQRQRFYLKPVETDAPASRQEGPRGSRPAGSATVEPTPHDDTVIRFGKHSGRTLKQVADTDPGYLRWVAENLSNEPLRKKAQAVYQRHVMKKGHAIKPRQIVVMFKGAHPVRVTVSDGTLWIGVPTGHPLESWLSDAGMDRRGNVWACGLDEAGDLERVCNLLDDHGVEVPEAVRARLKKGGDVASMQPLTTGSYSPGPAPRSGRRRFITEDEVRARARELSIRQRSREFIQRIHDGTQDPAKKAAHAARLEAYGPALAPPPGRQRKEKPFTGSITFQGIPIAIESEKGTWREGVGRDGKPWRVKMNAHYGEIHGWGTLGTDGDKLDAYVGPVADASHAYVIDQLHPDSGAFDEQKVMLGFPSESAAKAAYLAQFDKPGFYGGIHPIPMDVLKAKLRDKALRGQPISHGRPVVVLSSSSR